MHDLKAIVYILNEADFPSRRTLTNVVFCALGTRLFGVYRHLFRDTKNRKCQFKCFKITLVFFFQLRTGI